MNPQYPVYIVSKGRWESRLTSKALEKLKIPYKIVIEPQEFDKYAEVIKSSKILTLPFSNLNQGSIPARNWIWEHSIEQGAERHWILDDNIRAFGRFNNNLKIRVKDGTIFKVAENFVDRYENIALSGFNYHTFIHRRFGNIPPFYQNTRIYSSILIKNDIPYIRWRGKYNEDTDLSIRVLKEGYCTVQFNAFWAMKIATMTMKGGNTKDLYEVKNGRLKMAQSLATQHPDVVKIARKWGRWQHQVNYSKFKYNKLKRKKGQIITEEINDYGMILYNSKERASNIGES